MALKVFELIENWDDNLKNDNELCCAYLGDSLKGKRLTNQQLRMIILMAREVQRKTENSEMQVRSPKPLLEERSKSTTSTVAKEVAKEDASPVLIPVKCDAQSYEYEGSEEERNESDDDDVKAADKNIIMQMRKAVSLRGNKVEFMDKKKVMIPQKIAQAVIAKYNNMKKPADKEKFQSKISKSYKSMLATLKEQNEINNKNNSLDQLKELVKEMKGKNNG